jgi:SAM-dependent methyltransferase
MMSVNNESEFFDAHYFAHSCGLPYERNKRWLDFFNNIAEQIVKSIQPKNVLDVGCALGFLVEGLRQRGVDAVGVDISEYAIDNVHPDVQPYCWLGSVTDPLPQKFDLIVSIEVLEHLSPRDAEKAVENFCRFSDYVIISTTPTHYGEVTHFNVQPPEYWAELFAREGFFRDIDYDASFITPWAVRFCRKSQSIPRLVRDYERKFYLLWKENTELRERLSSKENLERKVQKLQNTKNELTDIRNSSTWRLAKKIQGVRTRFMPEDSSLENFILGILRRGQSGEQINDSDVKEQ